MVIKHRRKIISGLRYNSKEDPDQVRVRVWVGAVCILSRTLSSMQCCEMGFRTPMLMDGLVVSWALPVVAVYQGAFESPLPPLLQPKCHSVLQRIDIGLVLDDL